MIHDNSILHDIDGEHLAEITIKNADDIFIIEDTEYGKE